VLYSTQDDFSNYTTQSLPAAWSSTSSYTEVIWRFYNLVAHNGKVYEARRSHYPRDVNPEQSVAAGDGYWIEKTGHTGPAPNMWNDQERYRRLGWYYWYRTWQPDADGDGGIDGTDYNRDGTDDYTTYYADDYLYFYIGLLWHNYSNRDRIAISGIPAEVSNIGEAGVDGTGVYYVRRHGWWAIALYKDEALTQRASIEIYDQDTFNELTRYADINQQPLLPTEPKPLIFNPNNISNRIFLNRCSMQTSARTLTGSVWPSIEKTLCLISRC
jgi:hypothetical protein